MGIQIVDTIIHIYFAKAEQNKAKNICLFKKRPFGTHRRFLTSWESNIWTTSLDLLLYSQIELLPGFLSSWEANLVFEWSTRFVLKMAK